MFHSSSFQSVYLIFDKSSVSSIVDHPLMASGWWLRPITAQPSQTTPLICLINLMGEIHPLSLQRSPGVFGCQKTRGNLHFTLISPKSQLTMTPFSAISKLFTQYHIHTVVIRDNISNLKIPWNHTWSLCTVFFIITKVLLLKSTSMHMNLWDFALFYD